LLHLQVKRLEVIVGLKEQDQRVKMGIAIETYLDNSATIFI